MRTLINMDVPNLSDAISFYEKALGLTLLRILDDDVAELGGADTAIFLLQKSELSVPVKTGRDMRRYSRHWTPVHLDFVVEDIAKAASRAEAAGAVRESECVVWRGSKCITFSDPFGHGFCLIQFDRNTYSN